MNPKSKPTLVAALVLHALLLIMSAGVAAAEDVQEIGVPKPVESKINNCFDVHLSPSSDRFYTLRDGLLTQYQINPLKKLSATSGDWGTIKEPGCYMRITDDEKKLLVVDKSQIYAFDIGTGRLLNKAEWEYRSSPAVIINDDELVILQRRMTGGTIGGEHDGWMVVDLDIWAINTLKLKRKINEFGKDFGFVQDRGGWPAMSKIQDRIYLKSDKSLVVLNSKTYKPELSLATGFTSERPPLLSKDFRTLYIPLVAKVTDYLTGKQSSFDKIRTDMVFIFDQKTREFRFESRKNVSRDELDPALFTGTHLSRNKNYLMTGQGSYHAQAVLINLSTGSRIYFYQYDESEAIVVEHAVDRQILGFQLTPGARKYLMMDKEARIPINDATFNKYHRP